MWEKVLLLLVGYVREYIYMYTICKPKMFAEFFEYISREDEIVSTLTCEPCIHASEQPTTVMHVFVCLSL